MSYDMVIRNGTVIDGTGMACFRADIGIAHGRIAKIDRIKERGREEIDADGHIVTPGFIDGHTHMDAQIHWDPLGTSSSWNGVTTVVMGNCGFTLAPSSAAGARLVISNLERAEDISPAAMAAGIRWDWETFPEYMDCLDRLPKGINYATYVGHSALRTWSMGDRAFDEPVASEDELARMEGQLRQALESGAIGFSTSRSPGHETADNRLVASRVAAWEEIHRLVSAMGRFGGGIFEIAKDPADRSNDPVVRQESFRRMRELTLESGVVTTFGVLTTLPKPVWRDHLALFDQTAALGGRMFGQTHTRGVNVLTSFLTRLPFDRVPEWREFRSLPLEEQRHRLRDPEVRQRLIHAADHGDYGRAIGTDAAKPNWNRMRVYIDTIRDNPTVAEVAAARGVHPVGAIIDLSLEKDFNQFFSEATGSVMIEDEDVLEVMKHPRTVMTFSDSGAHVSQIADSSIQVDLLAKWTRERKAFTLEEAVRMITLAPARGWGFHDRGLLREGMVADINVIDYEHLAPELPRLAYDLPGGARRLIQRSRGIKATIVAGKALFRDGEHTGQLPGRLLRGPLSRARA